MTSYDRIATLLLSSELFLRKNSKSFLTSYAPIAALLVPSVFSLYTFSISKTGKFSYPYHLLLNLIEKKHL